MQAEKDLDYRNLLRDEYLKRYTNNSNYSYRAFARDLKMNSGFLSSVLNGKKGISEEKTSWIGSLELGVCARLRCRGRRLV